MPDRKLKTTVTFNRDEIREKPDAQKYSFIEARRIRGPIYTVLAKELYEEGCARAAYHFECLVAKEHQLLAGKVILGSVSEERALLLQLFENSKLAEKAAQLGKCAGKLASLKLLYQNLIILEEYSNQFEWLLADFYDIVADIMNALDPNEIGFNEMKMRFYYKYGTYLQQKGVRMELAIEVLKISLKISSGQSWKPDTSPEMNKYRYMHEAVARKLAKATLSYAKQFLNSNPEHAVQLSHDAILILAQVGLEKNKLLVCQAYIDNIGFMIESQRYELALKQIDMVQEHIAQDSRYDFIPLKCMIYSQKGICYYYLNDPDKALLKLRQAFTISRSYGIKELEGVILLRIGRAYSQSSRHQLRAREAFLAAREIFVREHDLENKKQADYMLAKLKANQMFPLFMQMCKSKDYCHFYNLRQWKNLCKPFWQEQEKQIKLNVSSELWSTEFDSGANDHLALVPNMQSDLSGVSMNLALIRSGTKTDLMCLTHEFEQQHQSDPKYQKIIENSSKKELVAEDD